jgi:hypothetical protein
MRNRTLIFLLSALFLLAALPAAAAGGCANCLASLKMPPSASAKATSTNPFGASTFQTTVSGSGSGYAIADGVYTGWCGDSYSTPYLLTAMSVRPLSTYSAEALGEHPNWPLVNYLLNHKAAGATKNDIQNAVWFLLTGAAKASTAASQAMIADAQANGVGFAPSAGQVMAVLLWYDGPGSSQDTFIEVPTPNTGRIGDRIWKDTNRNGIQDAGEPGIDGVTVTLTSANGTARSVVTTNGGAYEFTGLAAGTYTVTVDESFLVAQTLVRSPSGQGSDQAVDSSNSPVSVTLAEGENNPTIDFGYMANCAGVIGDFIWHDYNRNGVQDAGEPGIDSVRILLNDLNGNKVQETLTSGGQYRFTGVCSGSYNVVVDTANLPNFTPTTPLQGDSSKDSNGSPALVTLAQYDSSDLTVDFGFVAPCGGSIGSVVWHDANWDGMRNDGIASGINGVTVMLTGNGLNLTTTTATVDGVNGVYQFTGLCPGTYTVTVANGVPTNWSPTPTTPGDVTVDTRVSPVTVTLDTANPSNLTANFGYTSPCEGKIGRLVWNDLNNNGLFDAGESGLPGLAVDLYNLNHEKLATTTTDANGIYGFTGQCRGAYRVEVATPASFVASPVAAGGNVGSPAAVNLGVDEINSTTNFGFYQPVGSLSGVLYTDANGNGQLDGSEARLAGVTVTLSWKDVSGAAQTSSAITGSDGSYAFLNLIPMAYTVSAPAVASGENLSTSPQLAATVLPAVAQPDNNFGYVAGTISGFTYTDANANQLLDTGEPARGGLTVTLTDSTGATRTATTAADGSYSFTNLAAGAYTVSAPSTASGQALETAATLSVALAAGATAPNKNFGYVTGTISGYAYTDANTNKSKDSGEAALNNVAISLKDSTGAIVATTVTAAGGAYSFANLAAGTYTVLGAATASGQSLETAETLTVNLAAGATSANNNFGYVTGTISGYAYSDANANKSKDSGETALNSVAISLKDSTGGIVATTTTAADGSYSFTGLAAGTYSVLAATSASGQALETAGALSVALAAGATAANNNFGYVAGTISGYAYTDANANKAFDAGETPLAGVTVTLKNSTGAVAATATTAADGSYSFTGLAAGTFTVLSATTAGSLTLETAGALTVALAAGTTAPNNNFGYVAGAISGFTYTDANCNKTFDAGEAALANVTVTLKNSTGAVVATAVTGVDGSYSFTGLAAGTYAVSVPSTAAGEILKTTSPLSVTLAAGATKPNVNFGFDAGSISGKVFADCDRDKQYDSGESKLAGVTITLTGTDANGKSILKTAVTGTDGTYSFTGLAAGDYVITAPATAQGQSLETTSPLKVALAAGADSLNNNFGYVLGVISGKVYVDSDLDKQLDSSEPGVDGVTVTLTGTDASGNKVTKTTTTDCGGSYTFKSLAAGAYTVTVPATADGRALETTNPLAVSLAAGAISSSNNFGYMPGAISGKVYTDLDADKKLDTNELPLAGVTVTLTGTDANGKSYTKTAVSAADGSYAFSGLPAGTYTVSTPSSAQGETLKTASPLKITLSGGASSPNNNFGYAGGSIAGKIYADCDRDKKYDSGESRLAGVTLTLTGTDFAGKPVTKTTVSASDGSYIFTGLAAGDYVVTAPATASGEAIETTNPLKIKLTAGQASACNDFGYVRSIVSGTLYVDANGNRIFDSGEATLSGVTVTLTGTDVNGKAVSATATTDCNGAYAFKSLTAGSYVITVPAAVSGKVVGTTNPIAPTLPAGGISSSNNFGYVTPVAVTCGATSGVVGTAYSSALKASGGVSPYSYSLASGALPGGLSLAGSTGAITGTPTAAGTFSFTAKAVDARGASDTESCSIVVTAPAPPAAGSFVTYTQGGWGAAAHGNNPGALLEAKFGKVYPSGSMSIGGKYDLIFKSPCAIQSFLPAGGAAGVLKHTDNNPSNSDAGVFAGQALALQLNVDFSNKGVTPAGLASLKVVSGALKGYTVQQVLDLANTVIGGTTSALPSGLTVSGLNDIVDQINNNFDGGTVNNGYLK